MNNQNYYPNHNPYYPYPPQSHYNRQKYKQYQRSPNLRRSRQLPKNTTEKKKNFFSPVDNQKINTFSDNKCIIQPPSNRFFNHTHNSHNTHKTHNTLTNIPPQAQLGLKSIPKRAKAQVRRKSSPKVRIISIKSDTSQKSTNIEKKDSEPIKKDYSKVWHQIQTYYCAIVSDDDITEEDKMESLREELKWYEYLPKDEHVSKKTHIKYIRKSFFECELKKGGFVVECNKYRILLTKKGLRWKIKRNNFFIFSRTKDAPKLKILKPKDIYRVSLEGLLEDYAEQEKLSSSSQKQEINSNQNQNQTSPAQTKCKVHLI